MSADKYALLEARIRQTASLVGQLRDENQQLMQENERLRERVAALEEEVRKARRTEAVTAPELDELLAQLDTLHQGESPALAAKPPEAREAASPAGDAATAEEEPHGEEPQTAEESFQLGKTYERQGRFESAVEIYQQLLDADGNNLDVAQRLAFLLEKLNREDEAAPLWDRIWKMRAGRSRRQRWSR